VVGERRGGLAARRTGTANVAGATAKRPVPGGAIVLTECLVVAATTKPKRLHSTDWLRCCCALRRMVLGEGVDQRVQGKPW
jgi:hypothetical protein